jgi:4-hydroxy-tetrahydrodipicolinate synthase
MQVLRLRALRFAQDDSFWLDWAGDGGQRLGTLWRTGLGDGGRLLKKGLRVGRGGGKLAFIMNLMGCGTALVTPFRRDGSVDEPALHALVNWQIDQGIDFLIPVGTTGEASTLTEAEWFRTVEVVVGSVAGRVPVFAGCTHNATHEAVARAKRLSGMWGLSGILSANPYYNRPGQEGQYRHFRAIAEATPLPVLLYNIPSRTGVNLEVATMLRLAEIENIIGIKESSGNVAQITELIHGAPRSFKVFSGDDGLALPVLALGGAGLISVASNVIPREMTAMVKAALEGDDATARQINKQFYRLMQAHFWEPNPAPVKAVLAMIGKGEDVLRLPMLTVSAETRRKLERLVGELGLLVGAPPTGGDLRMF